MSRTVTAVGEIKFTPRPPLQGGRGRSGAGIWPGVIGQSGQVVHAGVQSQRNAAALLEGHIPPAALDLGVVALVNAGQELHLDLGKPPFPAQLLQSVHKLTQGYYGKLTY